MNAGNIALSEGDLVKAVHDAYSTKAQAGANPTYAKHVAEAFGYTPEQLQSIPDEANLGLSCGNPVATATIKTGEVVLDLGSGGGVDVLLAAAKVGAGGQAIGLDMSADMISLARRNAKAAGLKPPQVAFVQASLTESLPISSDSIDCILSNCVVNLLPLPGKASLLKEVYRVLKPGGRVVLDDIVAKQHLPNEIRNDLTAYVNCISGSIQVEEYKHLLAEAGLTDVVFVDTHSDLNVYYEATEAPSQDTCCSPRSTKPTKPNFDVNAWVSSYQIYGVKTGTPSEPAPAPLARWWDAYPTVKSSPPLASSDEVAALVRDSSKSRSDFAVIDVRRNDHAGGHVRGSHQWAAQTFYDDLPGFHEQFKNTPQVIFYCGSSSGRGPRCAGWYQDYLDEVGDHTSKAYVLQGGVKAWLAKFPNEEDLVDRD